MNLTITVDEAIAEKARILAREQGISLQEMIRKYLHSLVEGPTADAAAAELIELMRKSGGRSGGIRIHRDDAYQGRPAKTESRTHSSAPDQ